MTTSNVLEIDGYKAVIGYDPETNMLRGEFLGLNGGADFYSDSLAGLQAEGARSLQVFLAVCKERGIPPRKKFSGKLQLRLKKKTHEKATIAAAAKGISLNALIEQAVEHELDEVA
jgi:predicted HicB family RNase H-like nuclease